MCKELSDEQIQKILQGIKVPPQPQILVDLQMEQAMPDPDIKRISDLIGQDVGLAGTILKVVNSPFYGLKNRISSVLQAVNLIGLSGVVNLINGLSIRGQMSDETIQNMNRFWDTANDIAQVSTLVAKQVGYPNPENAYLIGLFHNCGIPLLMQRFDNFNEVMERSYREPERRVVDIENEMLNTNHAVVGYYTAKSWNLPKLFCDVIAEHHSAARYFCPENDRDSELKTLLAILKLAEHLCGNYKILGQQDQDIEWVQIEDELMTYLGLGSYDVEQLQATIDELFVGSCSVNY
ncbi:MAG: HDOD domain-containing protein [Oceanobacter sp.]